MMFFGLVFSLMGWGNSENTMPAVMGDEAMAQQLIRLPLKDDAEDWVTSLESEGLRLALQKAAIKMEILDPRETNFYFVDHKFFFRHVQRMHERYEKFLGEPLLAEAERLPSRDEIARLIKFNRRFRQHIVSESQLNKDRSDTYRETLTETDYLYRFWLAVQEARCPFFYVEVRRAALKKMKNLLGAEAYYQGSYLPNVPTWRYHEE